jgi:acetyl-CoA carboxylase biotin carboxyl carrier protein
MIDIRKLKELVRLMVENDLTELDLQDKEEKVSVKRGLGGVPMVAAAPAALPLPRPVPVSADDGDAAPAAAAPAAPAAPAAAPAPAASDAGLVAITSPMVGTFYSAPNPDSPAFVAVGAAVGPDTTVCLVEAMKVFNEIKAETSGTIERVLVQSGAAVEYGQKLFLVRPA